MALNWVDSYGKQSIHMSGGKLIISTPYYESSFSPNNLSYKSVVGNLVIVGGYDFKSVKSNWATFTFGDFTLNLSSIAVDTSNYVRQIRCVSSQSIFNSSVDFLRLRSDDSTSEIYLRSAFTIKTPNCFNKGNGTLNYVSSTELTFTISTWGTHSINPTSAYNSTGLFSYGID